jgi:cellulose synthase/poly-beta-1,6-N-acetylglucosamine synthase-like glycosyltransferase
VTKPHPLSSTLFGKSNGWHQTAPIQIRLEALWNPEIKTLTSSFFHQASPNAGLAGHRQRPLTIGFSTKEIQVGDMPQASFIVPTLNEEKYLQACLSSIVNQRTCVDYELIVVDGGSKDRTVAIAERYADKVICLGRRGIWLGRNEGASRARGRLLLFIDADTSVPANYLEVAHGVMQDEQVSALSHAFRFDKGGRLRGMVQDVVNNYLLAKSLAG